ncbi:Beta-barrel assembly-enhancing protease [BD1-7 clade bacterium]|uniref:Beta-barrel assembly-enhancing protease n=1 Tax=BD1-7 clade bacterium TaxID=2029982 RepID=A0A5S9PHW8_9GAMM|nr:Beta-barrel assembly-enhancing protease [BD1-7 clade bacterium]CAA0103398.1 Beta-barrel assembly-enhancing protease [BD1-7 clade bacterium]
MPSPPALHTLLLSLAFIFSAAALNADTTILDDQVLGFNVSEGAAPGYIDDRACSTCHEALYDSYQQVGMSQSFKRPNQAKIIEDFEAKPFFHAASQRFYQMKKEGDTLIFSRFQHDQQHNKINEYSVNVDWILGSGNTTRSYLIQTPSGELFQLPIGWYSQDKKWAMSPGFENAQHDGVQRQVKRQCMFCHNAYPNAPAQSDSHEQPHVFPSDLPQGTGCQRCHGPGAKHIRRVLNGEHDLESVKAAIVNPAKLPPKQRDSVCFQCHMLPSVSLVGTRDLKRADYSFRPGENLNDYLHHIDIQKAGQTPNERFEINHHAYRMTLSRCYTESQSALTCISCHNPHKKITLKNNPEHFNNVCKGCHASIDNNTIHQQQAGQKHCATCHMPRQRTQDVVDVIMTDHRIQKHALPETQRLAPLTKSDPVIEGISVMYPGEDAEIYQILPLIRALPLQQFVDQLEQLLLKKRLDVSHPVYFDLLKAYIKVQAFEQANSLIKPMLTYHGDNATLLNWQGVIQTADKNYVAAENSFTRALKQQPNNIEILMNLGILQVTTKQFTHAEKLLNQAILLRPNNHRPHYYLALIAIEQQKDQAAIEHLKTAVAIKPSFTHGYVKLYEQLQKHGAHAQAARYLEHGISNANNPERLKTMQTQADTQAQNDSR